MVDVMLNGRVTARVTEKQANDIVKKMIDLRRISPCICDIILKVINI